MRRGIANSRHLGLRASPAERSKRLFEQTQMFWPASISTLFKSKET
jgi:hypothetical protein